MRVRELIEKLKACNPDAIVYSDGCDCTGVACHVEESVEDDIQVAPEGAERTSVGDVDWAYGVPTVQIMRADNEQAEIRRDLTASNFPIGPRRPIKTLRDHSN